MTLLNLSVDPPSRKDHCKEHGEYLSKNFIGKIWSGCTTCANLLSNQEQEREEAQKRERANQVWLTKLGQSQIPERFKDRTLASYIASNEGQKHALAFATEYADNFQQALKTGRSALFIGKAGTGKTHLACGIALQIMRSNRHTALFLTVQRAVRRIKETWHHSAKETEASAIAALVYPDLLILDEIGVQFGSETEKNLLFDVLNERYERCKPTILMSNLTIDEIKPYLGERVFDRLREGGGKSVVFDWDSHR